MNNYTPDAKKVSDALKAMTQILDRITEEALEVEICAVGYSKGEQYKPEIHVYLGIDAIAKLYDSPVRVLSRSDPTYTHQKEISVDGVKLFELVSSSKGNL